MISPFELNLRHLNAAYAIGKYGSIGRASTEVFLSRPAVSQGIAKLERSLNIQLFERHSHGMEPTLAGDLFLSRVARVKAHISVGAEIARNPKRFERVLSISQIRGLLAIRQHKSITAAAQATGLSLSSIHRFITRLERSSQVTLFKSTTRGVQLTNAAEHLAMNARLAVTEIESAIAELASLQGQRRAKVSIGALPFSRAYLIPRLVSKFQRDCPEVFVDIREGSYSELLARLRDGAIDIIVGALRSPPPCDGILQERLFCADLVIVGRKDHPLRRLKRWTTEKLVDYPWIVGREGSPMRDHWERLFARSGLPVPKSVVECGSYDAIRGLLLEGDWLTLLASTQIRIDERDGLLARLSGRLDDGDRIIGYTMRSDWQKNSAQVRMLELLHAIVQEEEFGTVTKIAS